jgi:hypothetical protein
VGTGKDLGISGREGGAESRAAAIRNGSQGAEIDDGLARLIVVWPTLSTAVRAAIMKLVLDC